MSSGYRCSSYDRYINQNDDTKAHKIKTAYWTTKQAMIKKFGRKQDESVVASDADLDSKLALLKYQETVCYLSQAENEMGRFLKRYSLEDKTQAGKIMSAAGKALSHSAQQRLLLRSPLDRLHQEVVTFRQRAISDTIGTLNRMETARTEYRGALLWMKHVSEELDPDTHKQLEKFRRVQAQVRKSKSVFDKLKIDSMQKIDLLSASRCNMLSHALVAYQNSLLLFLEKTSRAMMAVSDRFRGYQYYEFSVLKQLRSESKKLAGLWDDHIAEGGIESCEDASVDGEQIERPHEETRPADCSPVATADLLGLSPSDAAGFVIQRKNGISSCDRSTSEQHPSEEELDKRLDDIFRSDDVDALKFDDTASLGLDLLPETGNLGTPAGDLISGSENSLPVEHRDLLADLFALDGRDAHANSFGHQSNSDDVFRQGNNLRAQQLTAVCSEFATEWNSVFDASAGSAKSDPVLDDDTWNDFQMTDLSKLPSTLLDQHDGCVPPSNTTTNPVCSHQDISTGNDPSSPLPNTCSGQKPSSLDAWMNLFSDLGQIGNPDTISKKEGQITDA